MSFTTLPYADPIAIEIDNCLTFDTGALVFRPRYKNTKTRADQQQTVAPNRVKPAGMRLCGCIITFISKERDGSSPHYRKRHFIPSLGAAHPPVSVPLQARGYVTRPIPIVTYYCREKNCTARQKCKSFNQGFKAIKTPEDALTVVPPRGIRPIQRRRRLL